MTTKGRVLRVKAGYNPNSSSVASELTIYLFTFLGAGVVTIAGLNVADLIAQKMRKGKEGAPKPEAPAEPAQPQ